jgi:hypothetical protein
MYSVFDSDTSTMEILREMAAVMRRISQGDSLLAGGDTP